MLYLGPLAFDPNTLEATTPGKIIDTNPNHNPNPNPNPDPNPNC